MTGSFLRAQRLTFFLTVLLVTVFAGDAFARGRMYNPELGRFMQRDPYGTSIQPKFSASPNLQRFLPREKFNPHLQYTNGMNLYQYVSSRPNFYLDPSGLIQWVWPVNGQAINKSEDRCAIVWSDYDGPWKGFQVLEPGDNTGYWKDQNDYVYFDGNWYKNKSKTVYLGGDGSGPYVNKVVDSNDDFGSEIQKDWLDPVQFDDDTKAPGKPGWNSLPSEELCRAYCECNQKAENQPKDCEDIEDCVKKCRDPWG